MRLLSGLLRSFIKRGRMRVIDVDGGRMNSAPERMVRP